MFNAILFWNEAALEANKVSHTNGAKEQTGPTLSARALAIAHLAMHDAYMAVNPGAGFATYLQGVLPATPPGASAAAAVSGAAYTALKALFPAQQPAFAAKLAEACALAGHPLVVGTILDPGYDFGVAVGEAILQDRAGDPGAGGAGYVPSLARYRHRPDPDNPDQGFYGPFYGAQSRCFAVSSRHTLDSPPPLDTVGAPPLGTPEYIAALRQVRGRGVVPELMGTIPNAIGKRTMDQTVIGIYWGYDGAAGLGTPPRLYNQIMRHIAITRGNSEAEMARLFALVNVAMADAGILAWEQKYRYNFWRPVLGVREHDLSMLLGPTPTNNISDNTDPGWLPLGAPATNGYATMDHVLLTKNFTPPFPAYPSGHATFGAAAFHSMRRFYGVAGQADLTQYGPDNLFAGLDFVSDEFNGVNRDNRGTVRPRHVRRFPQGLWGMILENGLSRVYLGVHWVFDAFAVDNNGDPDLSRNVGGVPLGLTIADDIFDNGMTKSTV